MSSEREAAQVPERGTFKGSIKIEVTLEDIAAKLMSNMKEDFPHKMLLTETIIKSLHSNGLTNSLGTLYNSLNGFDVKVDFNIGDEVEYTFDSYKECKVIAVDPFKESAKVMIEYKSVRSDDTLSDLRTTWVKQTELRLISPLLIEG